MTQAVKDFYERNPYPLNRKIWYKPRGKDGIVPSFLQIVNVKANILVVGCGVQEANYIAGGNPKSNVVGIDLSETSINLAKSIRRKNKLNNLHLKVQDITESLIEIDDGFDLVIASCVLHHIPDVGKALNNIYDSLADTGTFTGAVYYKKGRPSVIKKIRDEVQYLEPDDAFEIVSNYAKKDKDLFKHLSTFDEMENVVAFKDTFQNPYYKDYTKLGLKYRLLSSGFRDIEILSPFPEDKLLFVGYKK